MLRRLEAKGVLLRASFCWPCGEEAVRGLTRNLERSTSIRSPVGSLLGDFLFVEICGGGTINGEPGVRGDAGILKAASQVVRMLTARQTNVQYHFKLHLLLFV